MKYLKLIIIIPAALIEIIAFLISLILIFIHLPTARRWVNFFIKHLPDKDFYYGEETEKKKQDGTVHKQKLQRRRASCHW